MKLPAMLEIGPKGIQAVGTKVEAPKAEEISGISAEKPVNKWEARWNSALMCCSL